MVAWCCSGCCRELDVRGEVTETHTKSPRNVLLPSGKPRLRCDRGYGNECLARAWNREAKGRISSQGTDVTGRSAALGIVLTHDHQKLGFCTGYLYGKDDSAGL
jgi:hypothetical protein